MTKVNGLRLTEQQHYQLTVSDGEIVAADNYSDTSRQMRVEYVILNYRRHDRDIWRLDTPTIGGTVLRKDGSDSKNRAKRTVSRKSHEWPTWLCELTAAYSPANPNSPAPEASAGVGEGVG